MEPSIDAHVTPEALRWARESAGLSLHEAARRIGIRGWRLEVAEEGVDYLTLRQAEKAADVYGRPLAALFLPEAPVEERPETQSRRLPGAPAPPWGPEMHALVRRVGDRQAAASELYELLEEAPPWPGLARRLAQAPGPLATTVRDALGVTIEEQTAWQDPSGYTPLRRWTDAVEGLGVLVTQDGDMPLDDRGFAALHADVPAIVLNSDHDPRARAFTIIHELGHLLIAAGAARHPTDPEGWCEDFAGELLVPRDLLAASLTNTPARDVLRRVDAAALHFGVTPHALTVRAARTGTLPRGIADDVIERIRERASGRSRSTGGDYYRNQIVRVGPAFTRLVLTALDGQLVTYPEASGLLDVKVKYFARLRERLEQRAAAT